MGSEMCIRDSSSCDCLLVSALVGYLQHGSITWPDGACCISNVEVPSGKFDM